MTGLEKVMQGQMVKRDQGDKEIQEQQVPRDRTFRFKVREKQVLRRNGSSGKTASSGSRSSRS
jgi:hypothetical protein